MVIDMAVIYMESVSLNTRDENNSIHSFFRSTIKAPTVS